MRLSKGEERLPNASGDDELIIHGIACTKVDDCLQFCDEAQTCKSDMFSFLTAQRIHFSFPLLSRTAKDWNQLAADIAIISIVLL